MVHGEPPQEGMGCEFAQEHFGEQSWRLGLLMVMMMMELGSKSERLGMDATGQQTDSQCQANGINRDL
jgi:hypothetical protein